MKTLALSLGSRLYGVVIQQRNRYYDNPAHRSRAAIPVISVGNLTTGGTGKSPMVIEIARRLLALNARPAILTRGYRARKDETADEVLEFRAALPEVDVVVNSDRVAGAAIAARHGATVAILDDGFQHRRLERDLDIVLIDALNPLGGGHLLPLGRLREPVNSLGRAQLIIISRANQAPPQAVAAALAQLPRSAPVLTSDVRLAGVRSHTSPSPVLEELRGRRVVACCGLGNPETFFRLLASAGLDILNQVQFADHHRYRSVDWQRLRLMAEAGGASAVVTTRKDWVKLSVVAQQHQAEARVPLWCVEMNVNVNDPGGILDGLLNNLVSARS